MLYNNNCLALLKEKMKYSILALAILVLAASLGGCAEGGRGIAGGSTSVGHAGLPSRGVRMRRCLGLALKSSRFRVQDAETDVVREP